MFTPHSLSDVARHDFDAIIDVRSPAEYAEDHVPGAINLPVLDNEERARVGTIYKQDSPFRARKVGAALVFRNAARHIETTLADHDGAWRPLIYCWRGGQRSGAFTWMLQEIGWRAETLRGGYKTFRRLVSHALYDAPLPFRLVQLGGYTGSAKTEILHRIERSGAQVIDLEGLARHRGSLLGAMDMPQPSQKAFETALSLKLQALNPAKPVLVEAESSRIGSITVPPSLWQAMKTAPWIMLDTDIEARAPYLARAYAEILTDTDRLREKLWTLRRHRGHEIVDHWMDLIAQGDLVALCRALVQDHYDPAYDKALRAHTPRVAARVRVPSLDDDALSMATRNILDQLQAIETEGPSVTRPITAAS